jgi:hypothetical protein
LGTDSICTQILPRVRRREEQSRFLYRKTRVVSASCVSKLVHAFASRAAILTFQGLPKGSRERPRAALELGPAEAFIPSDIAIADLPQER